MTAERGDIVGNLRAETHKQAVEVRRLRDRITAMGNRIVRYSSWLRHDADWNSLREACGEVRFDALAAGVGLSPKAHTAGEVFLTAISTVSMRDKAWELVLRFSAGDDRNAFMRIWGMEMEVNALVRRIFRGATYLYRGQSVTETVGVCDGTVGPAKNYSFVSLSPSLLVAIGFAFDSANDSGTTVVLVVDAHKARMAGVAPATYSLASDAIGMRRREEDTGKTFPMGNAGEMQAHFPVRWPPGFGSAIVAITTILPPTAEERLWVEGTGRLVLDYTDIFSQGR